MEQMSATPVAVQNSPSAAKKTLIAIAIILAMAISFFLGRSTAPTAAPAEDPSAPAGESQTQQAAPQQPGPEFAPSLEDPQLLEVVRAEPKRDENDTRALGDPNAPVVMVAFEDFSCPMCTVFFENVYPELQGFVTAGELRIEFRDLSIFPNYGSDKAARGARAAANQGKFWEFTETAYSEAGAGNHPTYDDARVLEIAEKISVADMAKFEADYNSEEIANAVQDETHYALATLGITGTPFFIINDTVISGARPADYFIKTIENQLELAK
ncbi:MAG: thioredoxin domain-containing protein [Actinomycetaceae bacterium]|nr:thioredoxin domain-containing protein [Actinomycetaceae bacterium]